jgi:hypothetical protein
VDSIFMMPHLGVLSTVNEEAATQVFEKDCIIYLGTCVAPLGAVKEDRPAVKVSLTMPGGEVINEVVDAMELRLYEASHDDNVQATLTPLQSQLDLGAGPGKVLNKTLRGGVVGIVIDTRGRPDIQIPTEPKQRVAMLERWVAALGEYPEEAS